MNQPLISVVTVSYNAAATIEQTMLSVLNQTYPNVEYIVIDGGSTDGTVDIIKKYAHRLAYWVSEPDGGIYDAMNKGIAHASGDYIYFIGSDDLLFPDVLQIVAKYCIQYSGEIIYGDVLLSNNNTYDGAFNIWKLACKNICHQAIFYPMTIQKKYLYNTKYRYLADWVMNMTLYGNKYRFHYIPVQIAKFSIDGISSKGDSIFETDRKMLIDKNLGKTKLLYFYCYTLIAKIYHQIRRINR